MTALTPVPATVAQPRWWTPKTIDEALKLAEHIAGSSLVPKDYAGKPGNVLVAMQMGAELGLGPLAAMQNIAVINGRPALWGDAMLAVCKAHPDWESIEERYDPAQDGLATCVVKRRGEPEVRSLFSVKDAQRAGLWGKQGPWTQYPKRMLQLRARAFALRDAFPDALRGLGSAEEEQDTQEITAEIVRDEPKRGVAALRAALATPDAPGSAQDPLPQPDPVPGWGDAEVPQNAPQDATEEMRSGATEDPAVRLDLENRIAEYCHQLGRSDKWLSAELEKRWKAKRLADLDVHALETLCGELEARVG